MIPNLVRERERERETTNQKKKKKNHPSLLKRKVHAQKIDIQSNSELLKILGERHMGTAVQIADKLQKREERR